jgi:hypothetical protein
MARAEHGYAAGLPRARQQTGPEEVERAARSEGSPLNAAPVALLAEPAPPGRGHGVARGAIMRRAQQTLGNRAIQRVLQRSASAPTIQAEEAPVQRSPSVIIEDGEKQVLQHMADPAAGLTIQRKPDVPGLSAATETTAKPLLTGSATDKQTAIDTVVKNMVKNSEFSTSKLTDNKVKYNASTSGEGLTTSTFKNGKATESLMEIGDDAFASLGWLYSTSSTSTSTCSSTSP